VHWNAATAYPHMKAQLLDLLEETNHFSFSRRITHLPTRKCTTLFSHAVGLPGRFDSFGPVLSGNTTHTLSCSFQKTRLEAEIMCVKEESGQAQTLSTKSWAHGIRERCRRRRERPRSSTKIIKRRGGGARTEGGSRATELTKKRHGARKEEETLSKVVTAVRRGA
jgi:hypothetical protein